VGGQADNAEKSSKWQEAEVLYIEASEMYPSATAVNMPLWLGLCRVRIQLKKGPEAVETCRKNKDANPDDADAAIYLVWPPPPPPPSIALSIVQPSGCAAQPSLCTY
jgi:hypothetical protein